MLAALVLSAVGQVARASAGPTGAAPSAVAGIAASNPTAKGFSAQGLVAQAAADLAAGRPGLAVLEYERARLLAPRAPAVRAGLSRARSIAGLPSRETSLAARAVRWLGAEEWGWVGMAGLVVLAVGMIAAAWGLIRRRGFLALAFAGLTIGGAGILGAVEVTPPPNRAVVVAPQTVARIAPFAKADEAFSVPEGSLVTVERTHDDYALIAGPEGRGWVPEGGVELILPATGKRS